MKRKKPPAPPDPDQLTFDLREGKRRKAAGMELVEDHTFDWSGYMTDLCRRHLPAYPAEFLATSETFMLLPGAIWPDGHPSAWGAFSSRLRRLRIIVGTGRYAKSVRAKNHAHRYEICTRYVPAIVTKAEDDPDEREAA